MTFFFPLRSETFFFTGEFRLEVGVAQFVPFSSHLLSAEKEGWLAWTWENLDFRQSRLIHDQSLAEHKDTVLHANAWESIV